MPQPHSMFVGGVLDLLAPLGAVSARRMFGGYGVFRHDLMFALVSGEKLYLKVDQVSRPVFENQGLEPFRFVGKSGRSSTMSYHLAPEAALASPLRMTPWARLAWQAAERQAAAARLKAIRHRASPAQPSSP